MNDGCELLMDCNGRRLAENPQRLPVGTLWGVTESSSSFLVVSTQDSPALPAKTCSQTSTPDPAIPLALRLTKVRVGAGVTSAASVYSSLLRGIDDARVAQRAQGRTRGGGRGAADRVWGLECCAMRGFLVASRPDGAAERNVFFLLLYERTAQGFGWQSCAASTAIRADWRSIDGS